MYDKSPNMSWFDDDALFTLFMSFVILNNLILSDKIIALILTNYRWKLWRTWTRNMQHEQGNMTKLNQWL